VTQPTCILPIVEGHGDEEAVPKLIHRVARHHGHAVRVLTPQRRGELPTIRQPKNFRRFLDHALTSCAPILWVLDFDCAECVDVEADLADLRQQAQALQQSRDFILPVEFALMVKEFESLFLCDHETVTRFFANDLKKKNKWPPDDPENIRAAKETISDALTKDKAYKESAHQAQLVSQLNLDRLRQRSASFRRFEQSVLQLISSGHS
jgi:Domain of unknown function (DUF4276)